MIWLHGCPRCNGDPTERKDGYRLKLDQRFDDRVRALEERHGEQRGELERLYQEKTAAKAEYTFSSVRALA